MSVINEREIAVYALMDIINEGGYNNIVLRRTLDRYGALEEKRKAFVTQAVNGSLRHLIFIDYIIGQQSKTAVNKIKPLILSILRISVFQIYFMDKVPDAAVVNEAVNLARKKGFQNLSGYINGVLRNIIRNRDKFQLPDKEQDTEHYISVKYSYPRWLISYWAQTYAYEDIMAMCETNNMPPKVTVCTNTLKTDRNNLIGMLSKEGIESEPGKYSAYGVIINKGALAKTDAFEQGYFHIMDEASMVCAELTGAKPGQTVMDVCAAPGGKSFFLAYLMGNNGRIVSGDVHPHKLHLLDKTSARLGIRIISPVEQDMTRFMPEYEACADVVLLDAPCSGLGLIRKKPDIKYTKTMTDIAALAALQKKLLDVVCRYVKPGGTLIYSTCTLSYLENEDNVRWFLENYPFVLETAESDGGGWVCGDGFVRFLPHVHGTDGFFVAKMKREG